MASAAAFVTGCSGEDVMATIGLPTSETAQAHGQAGATPPGPPPSSQPNAVIVTPHQRGYLDALKAAGVTPSSDLLALSIGSYVCQAHAAKQSDEAVWASVVPMVRSDVRDDDFSAMAPSAAEVNAVTADYIRIATERLC